MRTLPASFAMLLALSVVPALASEGNAADGKIKAYTCGGCHGIEGYRNAYPSYRVPKIYRQHEAYLVAVLKAYRSGERRHPTMQAQGESLSDQDIADIAAYLAGADAPETNAK